MKTSLPHRSSRGHESLIFLVLLALIIPASLALEKDAEKPTRYVIGLSPFLEKGVKDDVYRRIASLLLETVPLGSSLELFDAYNLRTITRAEVPNVRAFQSAKTRANQFKEPMGKLKIFLATEHEKPASPRVALDQAVRFPQFMDFVGENLTDANHSVVVIVLGSPLYLDAKEPGFSMVQGYFPSDGHLLAGRDDSVFGLKERANALEGIVVHFAYFGDPWVTEVHQDKVSRFWTLFLKGQGAELGAFTGDLATAFNAAHGDSSTLLARNDRVEIDSSNKKIEMLRVTRDVGTTDWITRDVLPQVAQKPPSITVGPMKIGIRWRGDIDLDLYSSPRRGGDTLFFENMRIAEGYYFKDHRSSPDREYEFIEFESPVDVREVEARINYYEGHTDSGPSGEIRIEFDGKIYSSSFSISADHGNEGRSSPNQRAFWTKINIPEILKLEDRSLSQRD